MNKTYSLITFGLLASMLSVSVSAAVADSPTMVGGVNLSGAEFGSVFPGVYGTDYAYPTANDFDWAKSLGMELVRLPFRWERVQQTLNGSLDTAEVNRIKAVLDMAEAHGMRVILDLHNFGACRVSGVSYKIGTAQVPLTAFQDVWGKLANEFKDRTCIWGYDLMNEPGTFVTTTWASYLQAVVNTIRLYDTSHAIILEGIGASKASTWTTDGAFLSSITDSENNLIYSAHSYTDRDASGTWSHGGTVAAELVSYPTPYTVGVDRLEPFADWCVANNVRGLLGEYASTHTTDAANWNTIFDSVLNDIKTRNLAGAKISSTQWGGGERTAASDQKKMQPKLDNSEPLMMGTVVNYSTGFGTDFSLPFTWYSDTISAGIGGSYSYSYASPAPAAATMTLTALDTSTAYTGTKSFKMDYTIPPSGYAGAGMHIINGIALQKNFTSGHVLSFYAKGTPGANFSITLGTSNAAGNDTGTGNWVNTNTIVALDGTWRRYEIPLSSIANAQITGADNIWRLRFAAGPADNANYTVNVDLIKIEMSQTNSAPTVTVDTSTGGSSFNTGQSVTLVSTATDADVGDSIDYVEFFANDQKLGAAITPPYQSTTSFATAGTYNIKAVAFDVPHGKSGVSTIKTLTIAAGTLASFQSIAADDGYVVESSETSNVGGTISSVTTIQVGDNSTNCQIKGILSFDTSSIPDGATILSATVKLKRSSVTGTNPFTTHGACNVSIKTGGYSGNANLLAGDFQAVDSATNVGVLSNPLADGDLSTAALSATGLSAINKTNLTQLRIAFATDDNNNSTADTMVFYSGNDTTSANRPVLEVTYQ